MLKIDAVEAAFGLAAAETGIRSDTKLRLCVANANAKTIRRWTLAEDDFLRSNLGRLAEEEIACRLKRSLRSLPCGLYLPAVWDCS